MQSLGVIGAQWGDEGKGKISDLLGGQCDLVVRYQGGANAGHTIIVDNRKLVLHLIPSGILHSQCISVIGHGVAFDPRAFRKEWDEVQAFCPVSPSNLKISLNCSVITTYHKILDAQREQKGPKKIGTTGKGIGPCYEDKTTRKGLQLKDLLDRKTLLTKLQENLQEKEILFKHLYNVEFPPVEREVDELCEIGESLRPFLTDTFGLIDISLQKNKKVLYEGAQGILLDLDYGSYPYVTSSHTSTGGIYTGAGIPGRQIDEVLGVAKAYTTRVGEGPFPTELFSEIGDLIQTKGHEFGATTGRKRRCGWLDLPLLKYAVKAANLTSIALTKLDILSGLSELKVCYAYSFQGETLDCAFPGIDLSKVTPLYRDLPPFQVDFQANVKTGKFGKELETFVQTIEEHIGIPIGILAFGPDREEIHFRKKYFGKN